MAELMISPEGGSEGNGDTMLVVTVDQEFPGHGRLHLALAIATEILDAGSVRTHIVSPCSTDL